MRSMIGLLLIFNSFQASAAAVYFEHAMNPQGAGQLRCGPFAATKEEVLEADTQLKLLKMEYSAGRASADAIALAEIKLMDRKYCSGSPDLDKETYCSEKSARLLARLDYLISSENLEASKAGAELNAFSSFCSSK